MIKRILGRISIVLLLVGQVNGLDAQPFSTQKRSKEELKRIILEELALVDIALSDEEIELTHYYIDEHNGVTHAYFQQYYQGAEIFKAVGNLTIKGNFRLLKKGRLYTQNTIIHDALSTISPEETVYHVATHLNMPLRKSKGRLNQRKDNQYELTNLPYARGTVFVRQLWAPDKKGNLRKSWAVEISPSVNSDHWEVIVDASTGTIIDQVNNTVYCNLESDNHSHAIGQKHVVHHPILPSRSQKLNEADDGAQYRVFAPPLESPLSGERTLEVNPADPTASPFGWHDINGTEGADFSILRGNNVHAYQDTLDANIPGETEPFSDSGLIFDAPFDRDETPVFNLNADLTNLFYWNNYVHDWSYAFGFNEQAGNFQQNNYARGGRDQDYVFAETLDGSDTNNANFSGPRDGTNGRMQMFKWVVGNDFEILTPGDISGLFNTGNASFGPTLNKPISAEIVLVTDGIGDIRDACEPITNGEEILGKIAMIDRATCEFCFKVHAAQEAGAIACLVCNNLDNAALVNMAAGDNADLVNIPSLFLSKEDCALIKSRIQQGTVTGRFNETRELSSGFDNGIVVHEYVHGISMRLAGGPNTSGCLTNDEQAGEGISDFFALVLTQFPEDVGGTPRGIGTYVNGETRESRGIRRYPYSANFTVNPQIHSHIRASTRPHDVGEIWTTILWDIYWLMIERDGYDSTWLDSESGNFKAVQLVIDGLKIQECDPSFLEGRDALLQADQLNYLGENECLIWTAFARRGLGEDAFVGDADDRYDNVDGFKIPARCLGEVTVAKEMTPLINPGDTIKVTLKIENFKEALSDVLLMDDIPAGTQVTDISREDIASINDGILSFDIGSLGLGESFEVNYSLSTDGAQAADFLVYDEMEGAVQFERTTTNEDLRGWALTTSQSSSGIFSLRVASDTIGGQSFAVRTGDIKVGENSRLLRFDQKYGTQLGIDGGTVEVSVDQGENWVPFFPEDYLVNPITEQITFDFLYRNTLPAFTGARDWHTTIIDLQEYMGQDIMVRFRYTSLRFREPIEGIGWFIDDFELYERKEFSGRASLQSGGVEVASADDFSLINSDARRDPVTEIQTDNFSLSISPNPAYDFIEINLNAKERFSAVLRLISIDGKVVDSRSLKVSSGVNNWQRNISNLNPGMYFLELSDNKKRYTVAFIKQ